MRGRAFVFALGVALASLSLAFAGTALGAPFLYTTDNVSASLSQFDASAGLLAPIGPALVPMPAVASETGPEGVAVASDHSSVYVANKTAGTISQYSADPVTGALTPKTPATVAAGTGPAGILRFNENLYVANSGSNTISHYTIDSTTGALTFSETAGAGTTPVRLAVANTSPGPYLYASNSGSADVSQYSIDVGTGVLTALSPATVGTGAGAGAAPKGLVVSDLGPSVYVVDSGANKVSQYDLDTSTGKLTAKATPTVDTGTAPQEVVVAGESVYVTNKTDDTVSEYTISLLDSTLSAKSPATVSTGAGPVGISTDGTHVYVVSGTDKKIYQYVANATTGVLEPRAPTVPTGASPVLLALPTAVGGIESNYAYLTNSGDNTISQFDYNQTSGRLRPSTQPTVPVAAGQPFGIAASPNGKSVYVSGANDVVLQYDVPSSGVLVAKSPATVAAGSEPAGVAVSPDSKSVYVANKEASTLSQYDADPTTGALTQKTTPTVATGGAPTGVAVSLNGMSVYVTNADDNTVSQYDVDQSTGALTPKATAVVATGGPEPAGVAVSNDSRSVYVTFDAEMTDKSVLQFDAAADGQLTPKSVPKVPSGAGPSGVTVSPDGASVYVVNEDDDTVSQYDVDPSGALTAKTPATVATAHNPENVVVSFDGGSAYVNSEGDNGVSQFDVGPGGVLTAKSTAFVSAGGNPMGLAMSPPFGPPRASIVTPANGATFTLGQSVNSSYSCADAVGAPGIRSCVGPVASGAPIDTSSLGPHQFTVTATSIDGQSSSRTSTYTVAPGPGPVPAPVPRLRALRISPPAFFAATGKGASIAAKKKRGATVSYTDSLTATTVFTVYRRMRGHRLKSGRCSTAPVKKGHKPGGACTRLVKKGTFSHRDVAGANRFKFTGRVKKRPLRPDKYTLRGVPHTTLKTGKRAQVNFTIKPFPSPERLR